MKPHIAIVQSTGGKLDKYMDFATQEEADAHVAVHGGFVAPYPGGRPNHWIVDEAAETIVYSPPPPITIAEIEAEAEVQLNTPVNKLLFESHWETYSRSLLAVGAVPITYENPPGTPITVTTKNGLKQWMIWRLGQIMAP